VSHVTMSTMSGGKLFHNRAPAVVKARSPTVAHSDWRTSSSPADGSVMTADVAWMACQTTIGGLQLGRMVPCRSVRNTRLLPACTEHAEGLSTIVETGERVTDVVRALQTGDGTCGSIEHRLQTVVQVAW